LCVGLTFPELPYIANNAFLSHYAIEEDSVICIYATLSLTAVLPPLSLNSLTGSILMSINLVILLKLERIQKTNSGSAYQGHSKFIRNISRLLV